MIFVQYKSDVKQVLNTAYIYLATALASRPRFPCEPQWSRQQGSDNNTFPRLEFAEFAPLYPEGALLVEGFIILIFCTRFDTESCWVWQSLWPLKVAKAGATPLMSKTVLTFGCIQRCISSWLWPLSHLLPTKLVKNWYKTVIFPLFWWSKLNLCNARWSASSPCARRVPREFLENNILRKYIWKARRTVERGYLEVPNN